MGLGASGLAWEPIPTVIVSSWAFRPRVANNMPTFTVILLRGQANAHGANDGHRGDELNLHDGRRVDAQSVVDGVPWDLA